MDKENQINILVELNFSENEKVKISPYGSFVGVDGRNYTVDKESIQKTKDNKIDIVINENHGYSGNRAKATGWVDINSIEIRKDGIYASINWTFLGKELIDKKLYRYLSPEFVMDRNSTDRRVLYICGVGLVNRPNVLDKALNNQENEEEEALSQELKDKIKELEKELNSANKQIENLTKEVKTQKEVNHSLTVDLAIEKNQILPAQKEFCKELNSTQLAKFIKTNSVNVQGLTQETNVSEEKKDKVELNVSQKSMCKQLGLTEEEFLNGNS